MVTTNSPFGTKRLVTFIASDNNPPGLPLRSKMIFSAPFPFKSNRADFVCSVALALNLAKTMYPVLLSIILKKGTASTSIPSRVILVELIFPCLLYVTLTVEPLAPFKSSLALFSKSATFISPICIISSPAFKPALSAG